MRYILYCRKSTDSEDRQIMSLDSQREEMLALANKLGLNVVGVLEEARSAKAEGRPVFGSMLASIRQGEADAILCWKLDRLARNMADAGRVMDMLQRGTIQEIRTFEGIHLPSDNVLLLAVQLGSANQYIRDLSVNVKRGNRTKLEKGGWPNKAPFGYRNDRATKTLVPEEPESTMVRRMFELYATGEYSMQQVTDLLHAEGFRTTAGTKYKKSTVERIIKNPFYTGIMKSGDRFYNGNHEALISSALYEQTQNVLTGAIRPKDYRLFFPFRGVLLCGECECQYTASRKKGHDYYYCTNGKGICEAHAKYMRSEFAEELIAEALGRVRFDDEIIEIMYDAARERYLKDNSYEEAVEKRLKGQLQALERQELQAFEDSSRGFLRRELYEMKMQQIQQERLLLQKQINELSPTTGLSTLEPVRNCFIQASTARQRFLDAKPVFKKQVASEVLWNLSVKDKEIQQVRYKSYYEAMANAPKTADLEIMLRD